MVMVVVGGEGMMVGVEYNDDDDGTPAPAPILSLPLPTLPLISLPSLSLPCPPILIFIKFLYVIQLFILLFIVLI